MAVRNFLHKTQLDKFKAWLIKNNWTIVDTKGEYEILKENMRY